MVRKGRESGRKTGLSAELTRRRFLGLGLGAGVAAGLLGGGGCRGRLGAPRPNIVLMTLDTTRADHLSCYGYSRPTSPSLERLARESVLYKQAFTTSSWTLPAHATLFTGKFVTSHGARKDPEGPLVLTDAIEGPDAWKKHRARTIGQGESTLAELLQAAGYATGGIVGGPWMKTVFGLHQGFDHYDDDGINRIGGRSAAQVTDGALTWLSSLDDRPFFLFLNYFDVHTPYAPPKKFEEVFLPAGTRATKTEKKIARYDGEILFMDFFIGALLNRLKMLGRYDDTWIIVTSDHGELLGEHRLMGHGKFLYQEEICIPLFAKYPLGEVAPARTDTPVQLTDIMPMILDYLDLDYPDDVQGGAPPEVGHPIVAEVYPRDFEAPLGQWRALLDGDFKFLWNSKDRHHLFDLKRDPHETANLLTKNPAQAEAMETRLAAYLDGLPKPAAGGEEQVIDEETRQTLESMGYV